MTREEAIEMLRHCEVEDQCYDGIHGTCKGCNRRTALDMAVEVLSSAEAVPQDEQYKKGFEDAKRAFLVEYARESENMRKRNAQLEVMLNAQKAILADRPTDGDLISRRAVINEIERWFGYLDEDMIARISIGISKLPSADRPQVEWIPCEERLPDDGKWAIWCSSDGVIGIARFKEDCYNHFYPNETSFDLEDAVA